MSNFLSSYGFAHIGRVGSVLLTLSVTLERFFAVVYPLKRLRLKVVLISASVVGSILYNIPRFFELKTVDIFDTESNSTVTKFTLKYKATITF